MSIFAFNSWADGITRQHEMDPLKQRGEQPERGGIGESITEKIKMDGILAGVYQYQIADDAVGTDNLGRGAISFQPEFSLELTEDDEIFALFGFIIYELIQFLISNPQTILDFFIWPLSIGGVIGIIGEFCWINDESIIFPTISLLLSKLCRLGHNTIRHCYVSIYAI